MQKRKKRKLMIELGNSMLNMLGRKLRSKTNCSNERKVKGRRKKKVYVEKKMIGLENDFLKRPE